MTGKAVPNKEKVSSFVGISCYPDEKASYHILIDKRESFSQAIRRVLNQAVETKKKEIKLCNTPTNSSV